MSPRLRGLVYTRGFEAKERGLEKRLRSTESGRLDVLRHPAAAV